MKLSSIYYALSRLETPSVLLQNYKFIIPSQFIMETPMPIIFHSLTPIMNILHKNEFTDLEAVNKLLAIYDETWTKYGNMKNKRAQFPFIVFEGLDATGKSTISRKIAEKYKATLLVTPPKSIADIRQFFDNHMLRTPFYCLGNYIGELEVLGALDRAPVILDRYWHSTAVYAIAQSVQDGKIDALPPKSSEIYTWPTDLVKPDLIICLVTSEEVRLKRIAGRKTTTNQEDLLKASSEFRKNVIGAYENMEEPKIEFIDGNGTIEEVVDIVDKRISCLF